MAEQHIVIFVHSFKNKSILPHIVFVILEAKTIFPVCILIVSHSLLCYFE